MFVRPFVQVAQLLILQRNSWPLNCGERMLQGRTSSPHHAKQAPKIVVPGTRHIKVCRPANLPLGFIKIRPDVCMQAELRVPANNSVPFPFQILPGTENRPSPTNASYTATGKTVVITGGSSGVGRATALLFARKGWNVVVAARHREKLQYAADDCCKVAGRQGAAMAVVCDVTDERQVRDLAHTVFAKYTEVDVLVNCAGIMARGPFLDVPAKEAERLMRTNFMGAYMVTQAFVPPMAKEASRKAGTDRPSIIMINSFASKVPMKNASAFTASKYALMGFTEAIRAELAPLHIHVGQVHPGVVKSGITNAAFYGKDQTEERRTYRQNVKSLPISQSPQEVADAIYNTATSKSNDVVVGAPFAAVDLLHRVTGLNPMASPLPF